MKSEDCPFEIVEYEPKWAAKVADMWNRSSEGWLGQTFNQTEDRVLAMEAASPTLNVFLAIADGEVIGYCSLMEFSGDKDTLYIAMLNCRPDWFGRKVGKALVKRSVERTVELGWSRLDLYTWPGNTKAMPLYKKCGFFFENKDGSTHLMNFIPHVLHQELFEDFFTEADWYADSVREIDIDPDGRKENTFELYDYHWEQGERYLKLSYSRFGRGLCAVDNERYSVKLLADKFKQPFGRQYEARFIIENKTDTLLKVEIDGVKDRNIEFDFHWKGEVTDKVELKAKYTLGPIKSPYQDSKTHPNIRANVTIGGKSADFRLGIFPKYPLNLWLAAQKRLYHAGEEITLYCNVRNGYDEKAKFLCKFETAPEIEIEKPEIEFNLDASEKSSVPIRAIVKRACMYRPEVNITAMPESGGTAEFTHQTDVLLPVAGQMFYGETRYTTCIGVDRWHYIVYRNNEANIFDATAKGQAFFVAPMLGKPYSKEFHNRPYDHCEFLQEAGFVQMMLSYKSEKLPGIVLKIVSQFSTNGDYKRWFEVENTGAVEPEHDIHVLDGIWAPRSNFAYECGEHVVTAADDIQSDGNVMDARAITGKWLFVRKLNTTFGVRWLGENNPNADDWKINFEYCAGKPQPGETVRLDPMWISMNRFADWRSYRAYIKPEEKNRQQPVEVDCFRLESDNPFVTGDATVEIMEDRAFPLHGKLRLDSVHGSFEPQSIELSKDDNLNRKSLPLKRNTPRPAEILILDADDGTEYNRRELAIFEVSGTVREVFEKRDGFDVWSIDNGILRFESAPKFNLGLISLRCRGEEWLSCSFPQTKPFSWWNPWYGGMYAQPKGITHNKVVEETNSAEFVEFADRKGNRWRGIRTDCLIEKNESWKGQSWSHYYLTLPGTPIMAVFTAFSQKAVGHLFEQHSETIAFINPGEQPGDVWTEYVNDNGMTKRFHRGGEYWEIHPNRTFRYVHKDRAESLQVLWQPREKQIEVLGDPMLLEVWFSDYLDLPKGERISGRPRFFIFTEKLIDERALYQLFSLFPGEGSTLK